MENHIINLENMRRISATEITGVDSFSDKQIVLSFSGGRIVVAGTGIKIVNFSKSSGAFSATGEFASVRYMQKSSGFKQKLFK